ncbi:aspartate aminotransferase family protein [Bordetella sp. 15P40C-2]|uniref:aspartate aminotransferase family protein n=1 Tax=Bordetella sp. 15P40C-2 TaxID=2572246 RepID=UPI0013249DCA|nr:aspartate aminotransferase family protein [Bordetella sp. 15P40C-2]MVW72701.1 aminotransferase class III-fold pyridoxal phosphate-dependent enzyme [Bordetella sp. 15P40C-2]
MAHKISDEASTSALDTHLIPGSNLAEPVIVSGAGCDVVDEGGNVYLDLEAGPGVNSVGHCHPKVVKAIQDQAGRLLQGPGRNHSRVTSELAARITRESDGRLSRVFFTNSGAESNDGAIKLAFKHASNAGKKGYGVIAMEHSFHGRTSLALSLTGNAARKKGFGPYAALPGVVHVSAPYCYRCPYSSENKNNDGGCGLKCADSIEDAIKVRMQSAPAVLISESILCVGGVLTPPKQYWPRVQEICGKHNITLIIDEVFAGWGRTGKTFGYQHWDLQPDIVTFAKAIGGGVPIGGFMATETLGTAFEEGDHFTTFGSNNQIGMAAGHAVLDILKEEKLAENARICGERFLDGLKRLAEKYEVIGDVRGIGLMLGVELVKNRDTREPYPDLVKAIHAALRERKVLISTTGTYGSTLRITPPLVITSDQVDYALRVFDETFAAVGRI